MHGGWQAEFSTLAAFTASSEKDISIQRAWDESRELWVEAANAGVVRVRPRKKTAATRGQTAAEKLQALRQARTITHTQSRSLRVKTPMRIYEKDAYIEEFKKTPEDDGLECKWLTVHGKKT